MRRALVVVLSAVAVLGMLVADASAQAPAAPTTKVTISGLVDTVSSWTKNLSIVNLNTGKDNDQEWYARTRARPDITAEVGTTKFVLGLEIDHTWGQTGGQDTNVCLGAACPAGSFQRFGTTSGLDLNTDVQGTLEMKWAYTEFDLPGIPVPTRIRVGAQPWAVTYKLASLATGDFGGMNVTMDVSPVFRINATLGMIEEASTGRVDGFVRGDDWTLILSPEIMPFKGLDIRPIYSFFIADGTTSGSQARVGRGGVANNTTFFPAGTEETRHTIGIDARWRVGAFNLDPTVFYQFGKRDIVGTTGRTEQDRSAWFVDFRGGFQTGPLLLEGAVIYTTGNKAGDDIRDGRQKLHTYDPISTDSSYYGGWAEHYALNIDYFNMIHYAASGLAPGVGIGYDKYGMLRVGARASYAVTPAFTLRGAVNANWTAQKVDTDGIKTAAAGIIPGDLRGDEKYLGTEIDLGFQWRFAPGLAFDLVGAYTFAGNALNAAFATNSNTGATVIHGDSEDIKSITARVRYTF